MKKVMYFPYGGGHANIVKCLHKAFSEKDGIEQKIVALTVAWRVFEDNHIPYGRLSDYSSVIKDWDKIVSIGNELAQGVSFDNPDLKYDDYCVYLGIGYYSLVLECGESEAEKKYNELGRKAFCPVAIMKQILAFEEPDAIIITCGVRTEKAVGIAANELGIPVIRIADLPVFEPSGCDCFICVMNEYAEQYAVSELNLPPEKVIITGQPVFEDNLFIDAVNDLYVKTDLNLANYEHLIVYLEEPGLPELELVEKEIMKLAKITPGWLFVIKQHPNQTDDLKNGVVENVRYLRHYPLNCLLNNCDLAITKDSTAGLEAALLNKPLINLDLCRDDNLILDYSKYGISFKIEDIRDLRSAIYCCLDNSNEISIRLAHNRVAFKNMPQSTENIYNVLLNAVNRQI